MNKIGFIGYGQMAQALARGLVEVAGIPADQLYASARSWERLVANTQELGIQAVPSNGELVQAVDWVILAVKPDQLPVVLEEVADLLDQKCIISLAAGWKVADFQSLWQELGRDGNLALMAGVPNTPIAIGQGAFVLDQGHTWSDPDLDDFEQVFSQIAHLEYVPADHLDVAGSLGGCTPAYVAMMIEALGDAGVKHGLQRETAYALAAQALAGTGALYFDQEVHPGALKDAVTSPAGTTIRGLAALEAAGFRSSLIQAVDAIMDK